MRTLLQRLLSLTRIRGLDAAGGGRRWESVKTIDGLNAAILAGATTAARRAGWYAWNNPWVAAAVDSLVSNAIGAGIKPQSTHPDRAVRERLQALWLRWTDHATPDGLADFYGLQAMAVRAMIESGESFGRLRVPPETSSIPLHIELLDREQVPLDLHREIGGGARIRAGIEFDAAGHRVAYHVAPSRPGDPLGSYRTEPIRVPAADCLHLFKPLAAGQLRGITWLAPVLLRLSQARGGFPSVSPWRMPGMALPLWRCGSMGWRRRRRRIWIDRRAVNIVNRCCLHRSQDHSKCLNKKTSSASTKSLTWQWSRGKRWPTGATACRTSQGQW